MGIGNIIGSGVKWAYEKGLRSNKSISKAYEMAGTKNPFKIGKQYIDNHNENVLRGQKSRLEELEQQKSKINLNDELSSEEYQKAIQEYQKLGIASVKLSNEIYRSNRGYIKAKNLLKNSDGQYSTARVGTVYMGFTGAYRFVQGGGPFTDQYGERDIVGIPFL